jgi:BMFP domain-containing protein YqiC
MFDPKVAEEMAKEFVSSLPSGIKTLNQEMQAMIEQFLKQWLSRMSLVTREEFEIQSQILAKTRLKLELLEKSLADLEAMVIASEAKQSS